MQIDKLEGYRVTDSTTAFTEEIAANPADLRLTRVVVVLDRTIETTDEE
jgi:hypothetical protein